MQNCNFSDKFISETRQKRLLLSAGMDACHWFIFFGLSPRGINYSVGWVLGCKIRDSAGYCAPQGMRNILLISATPYQWKHMIRQRTCRRNTKETRYVMLKIWEQLLEQTRELFSDCGPFCMNGGCEKGKMTCGKSIPPQMLPTDIIRVDFPKLCEASVLEEGAFL